RTDRLAGPGRRDPRYLSGDLHMIARPYRLSWGSPGVAVVLALLAGWGVGAVVALGSPVWALAVAVGLVAAWAVTRSVQAALLGLVLVAELLPYAVIPLRVGVAL